MSTRETKPTRLSAGAGPVGAVATAALLGHGPDDFFFSGVTNDLLPGLGVKLPTLAFNLCGDSLRDAFDTAGHATMSGALRTSRPQPFDGALV